MTFLLIRFDVGVIELNFVLQWNETDMKQTHVTSVRIVRYTMLLFARVLEKESVEKEFLIGR